jgi:A/G-specific adenine glycosylase
MSVADSSLRVPVTPRDRAWLHRVLLSWYARNARELPWRATRDPYAIWVSEVMLQQTQVATATPYYRRFLGRFPTVDSLARAPLDAVLEAWSGLGYYRRARQLHAAAGEVVRDHAARVPSDPESFGKLPGIGRYTAGAVLSIAFGRALPVLDGNVARVFARAFGRAVSVRDPAGARELWALAGSLVPMRDPGGWNQALMELGATICTPAAPRCGLCPLAGRCRALAEGRVDELPPVATRRATVKLRRAIALVEWRGRWIVERRAGELLEGLWEPPGVELAAGAAAGRALSARLRALGVRAKLADSGERVRHTITHRRIEVEVWRGRASAAPARRATVRAVDANEPGVAMTALGKRVVQGRDAPKPQHQGRAKSRR